MSLKMKFVAAALAFGATAVNAQSYDSSREFAQNPEGAKAATCVGAWIVLSSEFRENVSRSEIYKNHASLALRAADKAYGDVHKSSQKATEASKSWAEPLALAKSLGTAEYNEFLRGLEVLSNVCKRNYPIDTKLEIK